MKKMFLAAIATFAMVSISSVFAMNAKSYNSPDGLANDTTADTTVTTPTAEPESATTGQAGDGMYLVSQSDTTVTSTDSPAPEDTTATPSSESGAQ